MKVGLGHRQRAFLLCLISLSQVIPTLGQKWALPSDDEEVVPGVVFVRFVGGQTPAGAIPSGFASFDRLATDLQVRSIAPAFPIAETISAKKPASEAAAWLRGVYRLTYDAPISPASVAQWLARSPEVDMVEPQYVYQTTDLPAPMANPNDPQYSTKQVYLGRLELDDAWDTIKGDSGDVVIAIVDEGTEITHKDLTKNAWTNPGEIAGNNRDDDNNGYVDDLHGWNFESNTSDVSSAEGDRHGTEVGGAANAVTDNNEGIAGAAWNAQTMALNTGCLGQAGYLCHVVDGILYATANGADVINCSWSTGTDSRVIHRTIQAALDSGALVVASAGNAGINSDLYRSYPAAYPEVLSVGATEHGSDKVASWSNYGRTVNVFAAGEDVAVTIPGNAYDEVFGTSFSSPLVSGIAALVMTERPSLDPEQVRELIRLTADDIEGTNSSAYAGLLGNGRANANDALTAALPPAVRLTSFEVNDANGNGIASPSESITIIATFTNYGGNASNLTVGFSESDPYADWVRSSVSVGALSYGSSHKARFTFNVAANTPENHHIPLYTSITDGTLKDGADAIPVTLNYVTPYVTHTTPTTKASMSRYGNVGHPGYRTDHHGSAGFQRNTTSGWVDYLFEGGLMLGTSSSSFADCVTNARRSGQERDFVIKTGTRHVLTDPGTVGSQDGQLTLVESWTSTAGLDVEIEANSYTFNAAADDDYLILHYTIANTGTSAIIDLHAGLYLDFDVHEDFDHDKTSFDRQRRAGYVELARGSGSVVGVRLLSIEGQLNYAALDANTTVLNGFTDSEKWSLLSGGVGTTSLSDKDIAQVMGAGPLNISTRSSVDVAFALVSGNTASEFLTNSDAAQRQWHTIGGSGIALSTDVTTVSERDGATTVTVTAATTDNSILSSTKSITATIAGSGVASAVDFAAVSPISISIARGSSSGTGTFTLTPTDDVVDETDETITISSSNPLVTQSATITLTDNDATPSGVSLAVSPTTVEEDDGATTITLAGTVSGSTTYGAAQTLPISVSGSGTSNAVDFAAVADFNLVIPAEGSSGSATFVLTPADDQVLEVSETITISSTSSLVSNSPTITLSDDDGAVDLALSVNPSSVSEGAGPTTITVTAATTNGNAVSSAQSITVTVAGSGVGSAVDFAAVSPLSIAVASGSSSGASTFTLTPTDDVVDETDETITLTSSSALVSQGATITLTDNDATPAGVSLSVSTSAVDEGDGATTITLTGTVSGGTTYAAAQTLPIRVSGSGNANAVGFTSVADFNLTIPAEGATGSATFVLTPEDDQTAEADETITISSTSSLVTNAPTITIADNDGGSTGTLALTADATTISEGDGATPITVTAATRDGSTLASAQSVTVTVAGSGIASAVDFTTVSPFSIALASGSSSGTGTFTLTPTDDAVDEATETITISSASTLVSQGTTLTLTDNDDTPTGVSLSVNTSAVNEGDGPTTITLIGTVSGSTTYGIAQTLPIQVSGSGDNDAVDFAAVADFDLVIPAESTTGRATFELTPEDDQISESHETVTISSTSSLVNNSPTITLTDDDGGGAVDLALSADITTLSEDAGATTITVTAATTSGSAVSSAEAVPITVTGSGVATAVDFAAVSPFSISIASGSSSGTGTFTLMPADDLVDEQDELITLSSTNALVTQSVHITLTDDDAPPAGITLTVRPDTVDEGAGATPIVLISRVTGGTTYSGAQTLPIQVSGSGDNNAVDFAAVAAFDLVIAAEGVTGSTTFELTPEDDQTAETDETVTISSTSTLVTNTPTITITDNDRQHLALSVHPASVREEVGATTITVTATVMRGTFSAMQTVPILVEHSGIDAAVDFSPVSPFSITVEANASSGMGSFTLTPMNDTVDEQDERIAIFSTHPQAPDTAFATLLDDDATPLGITLAASPGTIYENDGPTQIAITASVSGETQYADSQRVLISVEGSGVESAVDFDPIADFTVLLPSGASQGLHTMIIVPSDDLEGESGERITIRSDHPWVLNTAEILLIDDDGGMTGADADTPTALEVPASYPNPATHEVSFVIVAAAYTSDIQLRLYNVLGQPVATPFTGALHAGEHTVRFDASTLPAGVYMYVVTSPALRHSGRFIVAR